MLQKIKKLNYNYLPENGLLGIGTEHHRDRLTLQKILTFMNGLSFDFADCAWKYGNEAMIGLALRDIKKDDMSFELSIKFQSKVWNSQYSGGITKSLKFALQKIGALKSMDGYLLHDPAETKEDSLSVWSQLVDCQRNQLAKKIGVCNFDRELIEFLHADTGIYPNVLQVEMPIKTLDLDLVDFCRTHSIELQVYNPLANLNDLLKHPTLLELCKKYECTPENYILAVYMNLSMVPIPLIDKEVIDSFHLYLDAKKIILDKDDIVQLTQLDY